MRYFIAVAEERSFSRAASRLNMTQPPLSQQIRRLEMSFGFDLFERRPRGIVLTRAGETLLQRAYAVVECADSAVAATTAAHQGFSERLVIGFINSSAYTIMPALLKAFRRLHPRVDIDVQEMVIADQVDALVDGRIDIGILRPPVDDRRLSTLPLVREAFVVALPSGHVLADRQVLSLRDLDGVAMISYPRGHRAGFRNRIESVFRRAGVTPSVVHEATQIHTICGLVGSGLGISIVPAGARVLAISGVKFVPLKASQLHAEIWLSWNAAAKVAQAANFVEVARQVVRGAVAGAVPKRRTTQARPD